MTSAVKKKTPEESPYNFKSLSSDNKDLLRFICLNVGNHPRDKNHKVWGAEVFQGYVKTMFPEKKSVFSSLLDKTGISRETNLNRMHTAGMGFESAKKTFLLSAQVQEIPAKQFLKNYFQYYREVKGFGLEDDAGEVLKSFSKPEFNCKKIKEAINNLLDEPDFKECSEKHPQPLLTDPVSLIDNSSASETLEGSLHEKILHDEEILKIKKEVGIYPYGIDSLERRSLSKSEKSLRKIEKLISVCGSTVELVEIKVVLHCVLGKKDEAILIAEDIFNKHSHAIEAIRAYIVALNYNNDYENALKINKKAKEDYPNDVWISFSLAQAFFLLKKYKESEEEYLFTISIEKNHLKALHCLASLYRRLNQFRDEEFVLRRAITISNNKRLKTELFISLGMQKKILSALRVVFGLKEHHRYGLEMSFFLPTYIKILIFPKIINRAIEAKILKIGSNPLTPNSQKIFLYYNLSEILFGVRNSHTGVRRSNILLYFLQCCQCQRTLMGGDGDKTFINEAVVDKELNLNKAIKEKDKETELNCLMELSNFCINVNDGAKDFYLFKNSEKSFLRAAKIKNNNLDGKIWVGLGDLYGQRGQSINDCKIYRKAIKAYANAKKIYLLTNNTKEISYVEFQTAYFVQRIGLVESKKKYLFQSLDIYKRVVSLSKELNDKHRISLCFSNIGLNYLMIYQGAKKPLLEHIEKCIHYSEKAINHAIPDEDQEHYANAYSILGDGNFKMATLKDDIEIFNLSKSAYEKSIKIFESNGYSERQSEVQVQLDAVIDKLDNTSSC